jgi:hypothetical protein
VDTITRGWAAMCSVNTAVCTELQRRGYQAIHGDRELVYRGDPDTGLPTVPETDTPTAAWMPEHQIWDVEKVQAFGRDTTT